MAENICDILVIGSGAAGLTAAATSRNSDILLIEQSETIGGTTALSGGTIWIPGNGDLLGLPDKVDRHLAKQYFSELSNTPNKGQNASNESRLDAFLKNGPDMVSNLRASGFRWSKEASKFPDYHPRLQGSRPLGGRTLNPAVVDAGALGEWCSLVKPPKGLPLVAKFEDLRILTRPFASMRDFLQCCWMAIRGKVYYLLNRAPVSMGRSLVAQLLKICQKHGNVRVWTNSKLLELKIQDGIVIGAVLHRDGTTVEVHSRRGVLLATAGFARDRVYREEHIGSHTDPCWSLTQSAGDTGTALRVGRDVDAATAGLDKLWGIPTMRDPITAAMVSALFEISKPHSIVVNQTGKRFLCESKPHGDIVESMLDPKTGTLRSWLIVDASYRRKYTIGTAKPQNDLKGALSANRMFTADRIRDLAQIIGVDPETLDSTVERWNDMCKENQDADFGRGNDEYQCFIGDPTARSNPSMGPICRPPFYAVEIYPGDTGTRGGLLTDENARVLRKDGSFIPGLYAAGNAAASVVVGASPGAGATLGPAMTFGYIAANHMADKYVD